MKLNKGGPVGGRRRTFSREDLPSCLRHPVPSVSTACAPPGLGPGPNHFHAAAVRALVGLLTLQRHLLCACAAALKSAAGSYDQMPPIQLLNHYIDDVDKRRAFVDSMAEVKVK